MTIGGSSSAGSALTVLHWFPGSARDGDTPVGGLIGDSKGNLYGTADVGGGTGCGGSGCGVVLKLTPPVRPARGWTEKLLHSFRDGARGANPQAGLVADSAGNLYGTTSAGGPFGKGAVFGLSQAGTNYRVLHSFRGGRDGADPSGALIADGQFLYGTATRGGVRNQGVVFKLPLSGGREIVLHTFCPRIPCRDGFNPSGGLFADASSNLYGTTQFGGKFQNGVIFKISANGGETVVYSFKGGADGAAPMAGVTGFSGKLIGTTAFGGQFGKGAVFEVSGQSETVLHSFNGSDGAMPLAGVIADGAGNFYGTAETGGASGRGCFGQGCGVVFKLSGTNYTVLHSFCLLGPPCIDGALPFAGLIADSQGNLYGTTTHGGDSDAGAVFRLTGTGFVP
jgi:uncharacterized repeat protein (TIGR03803 family)